MKTSGLILDLYDDPSSLKEIYPAEGDVPETIKTAHVLNQRERDVLPDSVFALVMTNGDQHLRKYACVDEGNTALSIAFFLKNGHKLPAEAQKVAAVNLKQACEWYDLEVPEEIEKIAIGIARAVHLGVVGPSVAKQTHRDVKGNLAAIRALESPRGTIGGRVVTPQQMQMMKGGEAGLTALQPGQEPADKKVEPKKAVIQKTADTCPGYRAKKKAEKEKTSTPDKRGVEYADDVYPGTAGYHSPQMLERLKEMSGKGVMPTKTASALPDRKDADEILQTTEGIAGEQVQKPAQSKDLKPHVDISSKEPPKLVVEKKAARYALPSIESYPLDGYDQVKAASAYFNEFGGRMPPEIRHEYCVHMVKRAGELGIPVSEQARKYGAETYAPPAEIKAAMDMRRKVVRSQGVLDMLEGLVTKQASVEPDVFRMALEGIDKMAEIDWMYDRNIPDPYYSTYGVKTADSESWSEGNDYVTKKSIENYAKTAPHVIKEDYGEDFLKEFRKDPWGIFNSLPVDQKKRFARASTDNSPVGQVNVA